MIGIVASSYFCSSFEGYKFATSWGPLSSIACENQVFRAFIKRNKNKNKY